MNLSDRIELPTGRLILDIFQDGRLVEHFDESNMVVVGMVTAQMQLLGGTGTPITKIGFGTNGTAPVWNNTALTNSYVKSLGTVEYPASNQVKFNFTLGTTEANGKSISEFGLLTTGGVLVTRKVRSSPISKTSGVSFTGSWIITF